MRFGRVLNDPQSVARGDLTERDHIARHAVQVHGQDADGARRNRGGNRVGVEIPGIRRAVNEDGRCAAIADRIGGSDVRERRYDDFVTRPDLERHQGEVKRHRAVAGGECVRSPGEFGEAAFKLLEIRSLRGDPARVKGIEQVFTVARIEVRLGDGIAQSGHGATSD